MANRTLYPSLSYGIGRVYISFELLGAGASAPTVSVDAAQVVASISRSSAGVYVVTFKDAFPKIARKSVELDDTLNDGGYATCGSLVNEGTALPLKMTIYTRAAAGTATELALNRRMSVSLDIQNTKDRY